VQSPGCDCPAIVHGRACDLTRVADPDESQNRGSRLGNGHALAAFGVCPSVSRTIHHGYEVVVVLALVHHERVFQGIERSLYPAKKAQSQEPILYQWIELIFARK
jgi:hypothetical protein